MNNSPRSVGDRLTISGLPGEIIKVKKTKDFGITYLIKFVTVPAMKGLVTENEFDADS